VLILLAALFFFCAATHAQYSASISGEATSVLQERIEQLLKDNNYEAVLPYLQEMLVRLEGMDGKDALEARAFCQYQIGACYIQLGEYNAAVDALQEFLSEFPDDSKAPVAALKIAEVYASTGDWRGAQEYAEGLMDDPDLDPARQLFSLQLLGEALYRQGEYEKALDPLRESFEIADKPRDRNSAAIMLVSCFAKLEDVENAVKFLSYCDDSVRQNAELNVALIEAGDILLDYEDYANALILYREVLNGEERLELYEKQNAELEQRLSEEYVRRVGTSRSAFEADQEAFRNKLERNKKAMEEIRTKKGYDDELEMRIGQCYGGMKRTWPAVTLYRRFYTEFADHDLADDARFQTFGVFLNAEDWDAALAEATAYLTNYPSGKYPAEVSLNMMQVYMVQKGEFEPATEVGENALEILPADNEYIDDINYLLGYCYFQQIEYEDALKCFKTVFEKWPDGTHHFPSQYWVAMSYLFSGQFDGAIEWFTDYLENSNNPDPRFMEDASYRLGIALYGANRYADAEVIFRRFIQSYPDSALISEAYSMVGDLRGAEGELEEALDFYSRARSAASTMEQMNYATFQTAKTLELTERYQDIIDRMEGYLADHGEEGNLSSAGFWIGKAYKAMGQRSMALRKYIETVVSFGNKPESIDVDVILKELISENENRVEGGWAEDEMVMERLKTALRNAKRADKQTLVLRLETLFANVTEGAERQKYIDDILAARVEDAGPLTLSLMASEAAARGNREKVHEIYRYSLENFEDSEVLVDIMNVELSVLLDEGKYDRVEELAEEITDRFGYAVEVGLTRKLKADAYRLSKQYDKAINTYKELFANREWRGPLTPESLYWIGECTLAQGKTEEAFAFFQRVYVMYEGYTEWAAKAYEASVQCLEKLGGRTDEIIATYEEMLSKDEIAATPQGVRARERLAELRPGGAQ